MVATVAVPATNVTEPNALAPAAVVVPTLVLRILLPAVPKTKLPLVAVIAPAVAVNVVVAAIDPGAINAAGVERVIVAPDPVVVTWLAVPNILMLLATGVNAPPLDAVRVSRVLAEAPDCAHDPAPVVM